MANFRSDTLDGLVVAGANTGHAAGVSFIGAGLCSFGAAFIAASTGHDVADAAQKGACLGALGGAAASYGWNVVQSLKWRFLYRDFTLASTGTEIAIYGGTGYLCSPLVKTALDTLAR